MATRPSNRFLAAALVSAAALTVLPAATSSADPRPTLQQVQQRVDALNAQVDVIVEEYAGSKLDLATATRSAAVAQARVRAAQTSLDAIRTAMGSVAAAAYRAGGSDQFVQLVSTSTPQTFLDRAASLNRIAAGQDAQMAAAATARHRLDGARAAAAQQQAGARAVAARMASQKAQIESALGQEKTLLGSLKAEERARLEAAQARARAVAAAEARATRSRLLAAAQTARAAALADASNAVTSTTSSAPTQGPAAATPSAPTYNGPASGRASVAVQEAYNQLGKPYQWGASGPGSFDCSGLTMWAWGHAGVSLPHSAAAQYNSGPHISRADVQPGDLVFFGSPIHHVGIYIGNGQMISAPHTGDVVKVQAAFRSDYVGAARP